MIPERMLRPMQRGWQMVSGNPTEPYLIANVFHLIHSVSSRPAVPRHWPADLVSLITTCWAQDPHVRPNFVAIVDILKELEVKGEVGKLDVGQLTTSSVYI